MPDGKNALSLSQYFCTALGNIAEKGISLTGFKPMCDYCNSCCLIPSPTVCPSSLPLLQLDQSPFFLPHPQSCLGCPPHPFGVMDFNPKPHKIFGGTGQGQCSLLLENTLAMSNPHCRAGNMSRNRDLSPLSHPPLPN